MIYEERPRYNTTFIKPFNTPLTHTTPHRHKHKHCTSTICTKTHGLKVLCSERIREDHENNSFFPFTIKHYAAAQI